MDDINIVKQAVKTLGMSQRELADMLGVAPSSVSDWAKGKIPKMTKLALELLMENRELKKKLSVFKEAHKLASEL